MMKQEDFALFDYGKRSNKHNYGTPYPPTIDLKEIKDVPIALMNLICSNFYTEKYF